MKKLNQGGFHLWIILPVIAVIAFVGFAGYKVMTDNKSPDGNQDFASVYQDGCSDKPVNFTHAPLKSEDLGYIRPLGAMLDGHVTPTDHVYVGPKNFQAADNSVPVIMPADGEIIEIGRMPDQYIGDRKGTQTNPRDHRLVVRFSCRYFSIFIHVHKLADKLSSQSDDLQPGASKRVSVAAKAGETIAYIGGSTFDWTPLDLEAKLTGFISPERYQGEPWKIYTVSPFDLYRQPLKAELEAKSFRRVAPIGGKIDYDQPGKLIGNWFREGTGGYDGNVSGQRTARYWDGHLSIVPDYIDPTYTILSIGNWKNDTAAQLLVRGAVDPATITAESGMVKLELSEMSYQSPSDRAWHGDSLATDIRPVAKGGVQGTVLVQVQAGEKLKVEKFVGKTAAEVSGFTAAAQIYER